MVEWIEYPVGGGNDDGLTPISWSDGSIDVIPVNDEEWDSLYVLDQLADEIFAIRNFNCSLGQSGRFVDDYPVLFRTNEGVLVLRLKSEEQFMEAYVCKSRDPAECLLSWIHGDLANCLGSDSILAEGISDFYYVSVREVLAFIGVGLLSHVSPIIFESDNRTSEEDEYLRKAGLLKVDLPWLSPPPLVGPKSGYPACLFLSRTYEKEPSLEGLDSPSVAISVSHRLSHDEWERLIKGCTPGSLAERIRDNVDGLGERFTVLAEVASGLGNVWLDRWRSFY